MKNKPHTTPPINVEKMAREMGIDIHDVATQAKSIACYCVRNTILESYHSGFATDTKTGDFSDVTVIDGYGKKLKWNELSKISDDEMKVLMKEIVDKVYVFLMAQKENSNGFAAIIAGNAIFTNQWDNPSQMASDENRASD